MKKTIKLILTQFFMIATAVLFGIGLMSLITNLHDPWPWYMPFQIILVALLTALASLVYISKNELSKKAIIIRAIIHFVILLAIVYTAGYFFKWWSEWSGILFVGAIFILVYLVVATTTYLIERKDSKKINEALKKLPKDAD
ncbi:MAG: DUF3021 domain-containing protein [Acholeplasmatales bacterium]|nr:DUF3021 domain-containing protein [Acholeplasmatales bacterium]